MGLPVADGHTHSNPVRGMGAEKIAQRFRAAGGWFMAIVSLSPWAYGIDFNGLDSYEEAIDILLRECKAASDEGLEVACIAGFHPTDIDKLVDKYGMSVIEAYELGRKVIEYEAKLCSDGVLDGIGEVGRQHYKTFPTRAIVAQYLLEYAMELARDNKCIVHMHLEQEGDSTIALVDMPASRLRLGEAHRARLVFHHAKPSLAVKVATRGYSSTVPGTPHLLSHVYGKIEPVYILESDHIDDPRRPGAVVYPWVMAETAIRLVEKGSVDEEYHYRVNVDNVEKLYGVTYKG